MPYVYPTAYELTEILQEKVALTRENRLGFKLMPVRAVYTGAVEWTQKDNYRGLQQLRGLDGKPHRVQRLGATHYRYEPGVFGEFEQIPETEMTMRAGSSRGDVPIQVTDLVLEAQNALIDRENDRIETMIWDLMVNGNITIPLPGGGIGFNAKFDTQTFGDASDWSDAANSTPLSDFLMLNELATGHGVKFGQGAQAVMNLKTANRLLESQSLQNIRIDGGATPTSIPAVQKYLSANGSPTIEVYDEGHIDGDGAFHNFVPDDKVVVVGQRPSDAVVGEYLMTRNANATAFAPGSYDFITDTTGSATAGNWRSVPPKIEIHRGHNGGPAIYFPSAIVTMDVAATPAT